MTSIVTRIILSLNEDSVGETVSLRSEADQLDLISELINVTIKCTGICDSPCRLNMPTIIAIHPCIHT